MKAVLINPPRINQVWAGVPDIFNGRDIYLFPPLGIMYLSSAIKKHARHQAILMDAQAEGWDAKTTADRAIAHEPDLVGITTQTHNLIDVYSILKRLREEMPRVHLMLGGAHCWSFPGEAIKLEPVDSILTGDGEESLPRWMDALEDRLDKETVPGIRWKNPRGEVVINPNNPPSKNLDHLPFPDRDQLPLKYYYTPGMKASRTTTMITSRGCPHRCNFCNTYQRYSTRSPSSIVDEMEHCRDQYGIGEIHFIDDLFNGTGERVMEIAQEILRRNLKMSWGFKATCRNSSREMVRLAARSGCTKIHYGVETGTDAGLESLRKPLNTDEIREVFQFTREEGIITVAYMMLGIPPEKTRKDVRDSMKFIRKLNPDYVVWALMSPYPDTEIFKQGVDLGLYPGDCWDRFMASPAPGHNLPTVWEEHFTKAELISLFKEVHRDFYLNPGRILKTISRISTGDELARILRGALALLKMEFLTGDGSGRL